MVTPSANPDPLLVAAERIRRFEQLGGVDLSRLDREEAHPLLAEIRSGIAPYKKTVFHFRCDICGNRATNDQEMEPMCTGPNWTDDHEPIVMTRI